MQVVILAGGERSTLSDAQEGIPKPMVDLGGKPLLWHIMKSFSAYGINEFIVCGGYKIETIKEYFMDFYIYESDITVDLQNNTVEIHKKRTEDWKVTVVDTGIEATTGRRVKEIEEYIHGDNFIVTYGDCLTDINIHNLVKQHDLTQKNATMVMARPTGRKELFAVDAEGSLVRASADTRLDANAWVNANCYVLNREVFRYLNDECSIDEQLLSDLADAKQLAIYKHNGYWTTVETKRDLISAEELWEQRKAPWIKKDK